MIMSWLGVTGCRLELLRRSFILFDGIGRKTESRLWQSGACDWDDLRTTPHFRHRACLGEQVDIAEERLAAGDAAFFYDRLPQPEKWRMLTSMIERFAFIDIELDGSTSYSSPTVLGICRRGSYRCLVRGIDLDASNLAKALSGTSVIVTYNGKRHDLHHMSGLLPRTPGGMRVLDLRNIALPAGYTGGLKLLERELGIVRNRYVELAASGQSTSLWRKWRRNGTRRALELLIAYNREDTCNLSPIALKLGAILEQRAVAHVV